MKGFVVAHKPFTNQRIHFIDELYVSSRYRRRGFGTYLMSKFSTGPMQLRVHRNNVFAIALYAKLGFCEIPSKSEDPIPNPNSKYCLYPEEPNSKYMCMKTSNFHTTKTKISEVMRQKNISRMPATQTYFSWDDVPKNIKSRMVQSIMYQHSYTKETAISHLKGQDNDNMIYHILS